MDTVNYYKALYEIAREMNSSLSVEGVLGAMTENVTRTLGVKGCSVMLLTPDKSQLVHAAASGLSDWYIRKGPVRADVVISTALMGKPVAILDVTKDIRVHYREQAVREGIASMLSLPIRLYDEAVGVLRVYSGTRREFSGEEIDFLTAAANMAAMALDRARTHEALNKEREACLVNLDQRVKDVAKLEEAKSQLMRFLSVVAHDLKAPLAAIQSYFSVLLGGYSGPLNEKQTQMIERSSLRIAGLLELVSDLLDISRIELGQAFQEGKCVTLMEAMKVPLEDAQAAAQRKNVKIDVKLATGLPATYVSLARLQQVFANLLSNAVKFTPEGGSVAVSARVEEGKIRCEVADSGIGIPPQDLPRMFEEFFRASNVQTAGKAAGVDTAGTGLGLAIVRRILEKYGGKIWVESPCPETGAGTKFTFILPVLERAADNGQGT